MKKMTVKKVDNSATILALLREFAYYPYRESSVHLNQLRETAMRFCPKEADMDRIVLRRPTTEILTQRGLDELRKRAAQACTCDGGRTTGCPACSAEKELQGWFDASQHQTNAERACP